MLRINRLLIAMCLVALFVVTGSDVYAEEMVPIKVVSDRLNYDASGQKVTFEGNVHVTHPDAQLWSKKITILLAPKDNKSKEKKEDDGAAMDPGQIDKIIAEGAVKVVMTDGKTGDCEKAVYNLGTGILTMEGSPVLRDGANSIQGETINFYVKENKSEVLGSSALPVEALFSAPKRVKK